MSKAIALPMTVSDPNHPKITHSKTEITVFAIIFSTISVGSIRAWLHKKPFRSGFCPTGYSMKRETRFSVDLKASKLDRRLENFDTTVL